MNTSYVSSPRNDEHHEDSFESFIKHETLNDAFVDGDGGGRSSIGLTRRGEHHGDKRNPLSLPSTKSRSTRLAVLGSLAVLLMASLGIFSSGVAGNEPLSLPTSVSDLAFWSSGNRPGGANAMEACGMCNSAPDVCAKYGRSAIELSRAYTGSGARLQRVLAKAARGEKIVVAVLGGSVSEGIDVPDLGRWHEVVQGWFNVTYPNIEVELQNGAVPGRGTEYFMSCHAEHIGRNADLVMIELGINDWHAGHPYDDDAETLVRAVLNYPSKPAVLFAESFSLTLPRLQAGADAHLGVAQYYDLPVISLRNWLLPELLRDPRRKTDYFFGDRDGSGQHMDFLHINPTVHRAFGDLVGALLSQQKCLVEQRKAAPDGRLPYEMPEPVLNEEGELLSDAGLWPTTPLLKVPRLMVADEWHDNATNPVTNSKCLSLNSKRPESKLTFNEAASSGFAIFDDASPWRNVKTYLRGQKPGDKVVFSNVDITAGTWTLYYLRSNKKRLGNLRCWVDDEEDQAIYVEGWWERKMDVGEVLPMHTGVSQGKHTLTCQIDERTNDPKGGHQFLIIALMYA